jgi:glycine/D-amino acid oxidase-like deaminating enzyme
MVPPLAPSARLARVNVSPDRVIRTAAGLRPFRPSGFVVRAEKFDRKLLVHNYGHGGAGITLSWGTAQLAVEAAAGIGPCDCAVLGCGVVGLSTARLLQLRGYRPVIYARELPPLTTSNVAGGLWEPVSLFDHDHITPEFRSQFGEAARFSFRRYQSMAAAEYAVRWLPLYNLSANPIAEPPPTSAMSEIEPLYPEKRTLTRADHPFDVPYATRRDTMLIEPALYLNALLRDFHIAGGRIVVREFAAVEELMTLEENLLFNCTGLGAGKLFGDAELMPIRGQLVFLLPQPEVDYCTVGSNNTYMFPRHDGILLGGSFERGVAEAVTTPETIARILRDNGTLFGAMKS